VSEETRAAKRWSHGAVAKQAIVDAFERLAAEAVAEGER